VHVVKLVNVALDTIFEADLKGISIPLTNTNDETDAEVTNYSLDLVKGIKENQIQIDELITNSLQNWTFDRIPRVDRNILRIAVYELLYQKDVPTNVVISEAVSLAESLSTAESSAFVNGTLGTISKKI